MGVGLSGWLRRCGRRPLAGADGRVEEEGVFPGPRVFYQPHVLGTCWYYHNKMLDPRLLTMVARVIDEGPYVHEATIEFTTEDKWVDISDVHVEPTNIKSSG